jgi:hypothetical protein
MRHAFRQIIYSSLAHARDLITAARLLITERGTWQKGRSASTVKGITCVPFSPDAVSFCSLGALHALRGNFGSTVAEVALCAAIKDRIGHHVSLIGYNDYKNTRHADILRVFDRAVEMLDEEINAREVAA